MPVAAPFSARFIVEPHELRLLVPASALAGLDHPAASFFPDADNAIDNSAEPRVEPRADGLALVLPKSANPAAAVPATLDGVLVLRGADGHARGYQISAAPAPAPAGETGLMGWWQALAFAFLGGLILNLMPCVPSSHPVAEGARLRWRRSGPTTPSRCIAYALGVVLSLAVLGGALIALRASGSAIGWGFQLQSPLVVGLLAYLMLAMGLQASRVSPSSVPVSPGSAAGSPDGEGLAGAFVIGVLATVVATPCTAPFMGAALGAALAAPAGLALAIFVALGAGLAGAAAGGKPGARHRPHFAATGPVDGDAEAGSRFPALPRRSPG